MVQSLNDYAQELRHFVTLDAVPKPVLLTGYSYGGFVARYHAAHHPEQVRGIVLIDTPHAHWMRRMRDQRSPDDRAKITDILQWFVENRGHDAWISSLDREAGPFARTVRPWGKGTNVFFVNLTASQCAKAGVDTNDECIVTIVPTD
jgi:pimeloyl-ACP methyl ester carboxylesterase